MLRLDCEHIKYSLCNFELRANNGKKIIHNIDLNTSFELDDKKELIWNMLVRGVENGDTSDTLIAQCISRTYKLPEVTIMDTVMYVKSVINSLIENEFILIQ